jgi:hypothetical protein
MKKTSKFTIEEYLKAAEIGEVSMIDAKHVCSLLEEPRNIINKGFDCKKCKHSFSNPFDEYYCSKNYDIGKDEDCKGIEFESKSSNRDRLKKEFMNEARKTQRKL